MPQQERNTPTREWLKQWETLGRVGLGAEPTPDTANDDERTIDVVWFTGIDVPRNSYYEGSYILRFDPKGADLSLLNARAPVCDCHWMSSVDDQKGVVLKAWEDGGLWKATLKFKRSTDDTGPRPDCDGLWQDIKDGIVCKFSMGVEYLEYSDLRDADGKLLVRTVTKWRPFELSLAPIPADFNTTTLAAESIAADNLARQELAKNGPTGQTGDVMVEDPNRPAANPAEARPEPQPAAVDTEKLRREAVEAERLRANSIRKRVSIAGLSDTFAQTLVDEGVSLDAASERIFAELAKASPEIRGHAAITRDGTETRRQAIANALLHRYQPTTHKLEAGREYMGLSLIELARECVSASGKSVRGVSRDDVAQLAMHGTSDFPGILADVANKTLRQAYETAPVTFRPLARRITASDFKAINLLQLGEAPQLDKVLANGEFTRGTIGESKESLKVETFGKVVAITRQVIINDDLDAFTRVPAAFGVQAANKESDIVWSLITTNGNMSDGSAIFHANHKNLGNAAAISVDSVGEGRALMAKQTGIDKKTILNIRPKFLVVPSALETKAEQFVSANLLPAQTSAVVPVSLRSLVPIAEPRLDVNSAISWYLFADPNQIDTVVYAYLEGQEGVYIETRMGFDVDGVEIKARLDFGASVADFRGLVKNVGA